MLLPSRAGQEDHTGPLGHDVRHQEVPIAPKGHGHLVVHSQLRLPAKGEQSTRVQSMFSAIKATDQPNSPSPTSSTLAALIEAESAVQRLRKRSPVRDHGWLCELVARRPSVRVRGCRPRRSGLSALLISSRVRPRSCAARMTAPRRSVSRAKRRWPPAVLSETISPRDS